MIVYEDAWCKIEIMSAAFPGCYYVVLDGDDETAQACVSLEDAEATVEEMREEFIEDNGQFGVGA